MFYFNQLLFYPSCLSVVEEELPTLTRHTPNRHQGTSGDQKLTVVSRQYSRQPALHMAVVFYRHSIRETGRRIGTFDIPTVVMLSSACLPL